MVCAAMAAAALAGSAGVVEGWNHSPDWPNGVIGRFGMVATRMPTGSPVYVKPECPFPAAAPGSIPDGCTPVRAVECGPAVVGEPGSQSELRDPKAVKALFAAYRTTHIRDYISSEHFCTLQAENDFPIAFVDAHGTAILTVAPRDRCDHIVAEVKRVATEGLWVDTPLAPTH